MDIIVEPSGGRQDDFNGIINQSFHSEDSRDHEDPDHEDPDEEEEEVSVLSTHGVEGSVYSVLMVMRGQCT